MTLVRPSIISDAKDASVNFQANPSINPEQRFVSTTAITRPHSQTPPQKRKNVQSSKNQTLR
jgi:hypothetical protein